MCLPVTTRGNKIGNFTNEYTFVGSDGVTDTDFKTAKNFVIKLVESFIRLDKHFGLVVYGDKGEIIVPLLEKFSPAEIEAKIRDAKKPGGYRNTLRELEWIGIEKLSSTENIVTLLLTSGPSSNPGYTLDSARYFAGFTYGIGIGIGETHPEAELNEIAKNNTNAIFKVAKYDELFGLLSPIMEAICRAYPATARSHVIQPSSRVKPSSSCKRRAKALTR